MELTTAYSVFANNGVRVSPTTILRVEKNDGQVLFDHAATEPIPVIDPRVAFLITDILDDDGARIPAMGQNNPLDLPFPAAAKTGTSNNFRDNWTVGYTPGLVVGVWTGNTSAGTFSGLRIQKANESGKDTPEIGPSVYQDWQKQLFSTFENRRSVRKFTDDPVPDDPGTSNVRKKTL